MKATARESTGASLPLTTYACMRVKLLSDSFFFLYFEMLFRKKTFSASSSRANCDVGSLASTAVRRAGTQPFAATH